MTFLITSGSGRWQTRPDRLEMLLGSFFCVCSTHSQYKTVSQQWKKKNVRSLLRFHSKQPNHFFLCSARFLTWFMLLRFCSSRGGLEKEENFSFVVLREKKAAKKMKGKISFVFCRKKIHLNVLFASYSIMYFTSCTTLTSSHSWNECKWKFLSWNTSSLSDDITRH